MFMSLILFIVTIMQRVRKRRINCEQDMLEAVAQTALAIAGKTKVSFLEEVDYKMEEAGDMEERKFMMIDQQPEEQIHQAFKKKRKHTL